MVWHEMIEDLLLRRHTYASIGAEVGVTGAAIRALMINREQEPRWVTGDKLIVMHKKAMRRRK